MIVKIGILAIQGGFLEHINAFKRCSEGYAKKDVKIELLELRNTNDLLDDIDGVVLPGGTLEVFVFLSMFYLSISPLAIYVAVRPATLLERDAGTDFFQLTFQIF